MIYGILKYFNDELTGWNRIIEFHKQETGEVVRKITVMLDQQIIPCLHKVESNHYIDQFMVQEQKFDHLTSQITSQRQRLEQSDSFAGKLIEESICQQQDLLRGRMHTSERNFIRTKYTCSIFLSSFLNDQVTPPQRIKSLQNHVKVKQGALSV